MSINTVRDDWPSYHYDPVRDRERERCGLDGIHMLLICNAQSLVPLHLMSYISCLSNRHLRASGRDEIEHRDAVARGSVPFRGLVGDPHLSAPPPFRNGDEGIGGNRSLEK